MNEFEKYPELAEQIRYYASYGQFRDYNKFTIELNKALSNREKIMDLLFDFYCEVEAIVNAWGPRRKQHDLYSLLEMAQPILEDTGHLEYCECKNPSDNSDIEPYCVKCEKDIKI